MHATQLDRAARRLRAAAGPPAGPADRQLLARYSAGGDPAAFAELVGRHGPMVLAVCRRVLRHEQDAEDAFQATFLVLARRARSIRRGEALASWLHGVAHRVALRARRDAGRRRAHERQVRPVPAPTPAGEADWREVQAALDEEVRALPGAYRAPFVLCFLEGRSRAEAAAELGLKEGTVWSRLARARELLRDRLARRGVSLPALLAAAALSAGAGRAVPAGLADAAARAALGASGVTARAAALAAAAGRAAPAKAVGTLLGLAAAGLLAAAVLPGGGPPAPPDPRPAAAAPPPAAAPKPPPTPDPEDPKFAGHFTGRVSGPDGKPLAGARVYVARFYDESRNPGPVRAATGPDGRFAFDAPDLTFTEFDGLPARRTGLIVVTKDGHGPDWFRTWGHRTGRGLRTHWDPVKGAEVDLHLAADDVPVRGRFLGPDGKPLAGARVRLTGLMIPRKRDLDAHLARERTRPPYTMDDYERGIDPARVPGLAAEARTDADGRFTFRGLGRDRLAELEVTDPAVVDTRLLVMTRAAPDVPALPDHDKKFTRTIHGADFTVRLNRGLTVTGVVRDRDTKAPVPGMWVSRYGNPLTDREVAAVTPVTDAAGRFTLTGLDPKLLTYKPEHREVWAIPRPGTLYLTTTGVIGPDATAVVECVRGIPFRLRLTDEAGKPAEGTVTYFPLSPNPAAEELAERQLRTNWPVMNRAARRADGTYEGFALPGPGAVVVEMADPDAWRPARVDPKAFFEPKRTDWPEHADSLYGTPDTLSAFGGWHDQRGYAAVVLVNPAKGSGPLDLAAAVVRDRPRRVSVVDPDGKPVAGAVAHLYRRYAHSDLEEKLRGDSFPLTGLHPDRVQGITVVKADRKLVGFAKVRGDAGTPLTIKLQPWGSVTGRLVGPDGTPADRPFGRGGPAVRPDDPDGSRFYVTTGGKGGRFRIDGLVPGQGYTSDRVYYDIAEARPADVFEKLVLRPGEVRDVGDVVVRPPGAGPKR